MGCYGWLTLAPSLLVRHGYSLSAGITFLMVSGVGFVAGASLVPTVADRFEQRSIAAVVALLWTGALVVIGNLTSGAVVMLFGFLCCATIGVIVPVLYTYTAEQFPTAIRARGVAVTDGLGHLGGAVCPLFVLGGFHLWHFSGAFDVMAATGVLTAAVVSFGRRGSGRPLD